MKARFPNLIIPAMMILSACGASKTRAMNPEPAGEEPAGSGPGGEAGSGGETADAPPPADAFVYTAAGCTPKTVPMSGDELPVAASLDEFRDLIGCDPSSPVDWSAEHVAVVRLAGTNTNFFYQGVTMAEGVAVVTVNAHAYVAGAALYMDTTLLVRIPGEAASAKLELIHTQQEWTGPLPP